MQIFFRYLLIPLQNAEIIGQMEFIEIGMNHPMRKHVLHPLPHRFQKTLRRFTQNAEEFLFKRRGVFRKVRVRLYQQRLVQILPDVITCPLTDKGITSRAYIYIIKEAVRDLGLVLLDGQRIHSSLSQSQATVRQRTKQAIG